MADARENQSIRISFLDILRSEGTFGLKAVKLLDFLGGGLLARVVWGVAPVQDFPAGVKNILVIRPGGIGDAIFLLPFLRFIKKDKDVRLDILCEKRNKAVFESQSGSCDNIYWYDSAGSLIKVFKNRYDVVIDTEQWHYLSALTAYFLKPKISVGFATRPLRRKLFHQPKEYLQDAYEMENFEKLFASLLGPDWALRDINGCFIVKEELRSWAGEQIPAGSVCLALGGSIPIRRFTETQAVAIIEHLLSLDFAVVLLGGRDVLGFGRALKERTKDKKVYNFVGKMSLDQTAALIQKSRLFIGHDSGLMHLACAVGTPVAAIFGPGNRSKWAPKGQEHTVISNNQTCSPCTIFGYTIPICKNVFPCTLALDRGHMASVIEKRI
jgi:ADP-heptose:LPS heptosyltransferase